MWWGKTLLLVIFTLGVGLHHGAQLLDVPDRVLEDVHLAHLLRLRGGGHVQSEVLVALVHVLHPRTLPRVPFRHRWRQGRGDRVAQGWVEDHSTTAGQTSSYCGILHLLSLEDGSFPRCVSLFLCAVFAGSVVSWLFRWLSSQSNLPAAPLVRCLLSELPPPSKYLAGRRRLTPNHPSYLSTGELAGDNFGFSRGFLLLFFYSHHAQGPAH